MLENPFDDPKHKRERAEMRPVIGAVLAAFICIVLVMIASYAYADPVFEAEDGGIRITLHNDPCKLEAVTNLPHRATWTEKGKVYEGCYGLTRFGVVMAYFDDKTVAVIPTEFFQRVHGA
jgi:hypothetical protein